jgi:MoaA/NifB/PqqE/SkfB family radical SAM enzyme
MPQPKVIHFSLTDACNLSCGHCDIWKRPVGKELKLEQWRQIVGAMHEWLGPFILKIAGGEPFVRKWLPDLVSFARERGIFVGASTNGVLFDRPAVHRLLEAGLNEINISLDSLQPAVHDGLRNHPGCFAAVMRTIELFQEAEPGKIEINIATVIIEQNLEELIDLAYWTKERKLRTITYQPLMQNFGASYNCHWYKESPYFPQRVELLEKVLDELIAFRKKFWTVGNHEKQMNLMKLYFSDPEHEPYERCTAGQGDLGVDPFGNVYLCFNLDPVGNLLEKGPAEIFASPIASRRREEISNCKRSCYLLNCVSADEAFG